jgi:hypothetical protein
MDLAKALDELPEAHAAGIRMHRAGMDAAAIATVLHIEKEAVAPLLQVAEAKLAVLLKAPDPSREGGPLRSCQGPQPGPEPELVTSANGEPSDHSDSHLGEPDEKCRARCRS